jgi:hypothetical protein
MHVAPHSLAIAGAWGYIGRKFLEAGMCLGLRPRVFDPGPLPDDISLESLDLFADESAFYRQHVDLFHLALQPEARQRALSTLLERGRSEPIAILNEKPMAAPENPEHCLWLLEMLKSGKAIVLFDFLELFSPMTEMVVNYLSGFRDVTIDSIEMHRMKDREDPSNPRNYKRMVPIQYQESVHCLAWVLHLFSRLRGSVEQSIDDGLVVQSQSQDYSAPNPQDYPYVVDGECRWHIRWGRTEINGHTNFKRHAQWTKRRLVQGHADGRPFKIEAEFQEGQKRLIIDGVNQDVDPLGSSYVDVLRTFAIWQSRIEREKLMFGVYPNSSFAYATYQLSSALWRASRDRRTLRFNTYQQLLGFDANYRSEVPNFSNML